MLRNLEDRLERMVEGVFARAFRSGLQPVEIGRRLERELDTRRTLGPNGQPVGPNAYTVFLAPDDYERFHQVADSLRLELVVELSGHAADRGIRFPGRVAVGLECDESLGTGRFNVESAFVEGVPEGAPPAYLELPNGERVALTGQRITLGRQHGCSIVLNDANVSRRQAEILADGDGHRLVDLGSTNGSRVNDVHVADHALVDGDVLGFGSISLVYRSL